MILPLMYKLTIVTPSRYISRNKQLAVDSFAVIRHDVTPPLLV